MTLAAKDVAQYLKDHPEFFNQYAETLAQLSIPDPHGGRAVSISERQVGTLRDQIKRLDAKMNELIRFGEENDLLLAKTHRMVVDLTAAADSAAALRVLYDHFGEAFDVPHVAIRLWDVYGDPDAPEFAPMSVAAHEFAATLDRPYCGAGSGPDVLDWFGEQGAQVQSIALIALMRGDKPFGLVALGSEDPRRFYHEMGTLYLDRIGDVAAATLARTFR